MISLHLFFSRYDRYENKQLYWVEEETEAEWEKTTAKSIRQESEYQTETNAMSAMEASLAPIEFGPGTGPEGKIWVRLLKGSIHEDHYSSTWEPLIRRNFLGIQ